MDRKAASSAGAAAVDPFSDTGEEDVPDAEFDTDGADRWIGDDSNDVSNGGLITGSHDAAVRTARAQKPAAKTGLFGPGSSGTGHGNGNGNSGAGSGGGGGGGGASVYYSAEPLPSLFDNLNATDLWGALSHSNSSVASSTESGGGSVMNTSIATPTPSGGGVISTPFQLAVATATQSAQELYHQTQSVIAGTGTGTGSGSKPPPPPTAIGSGGGALSSALQNVDPRFVAFTAAHASVQGKSVTLAGTMNQVGSTDRTHPSQVQLMKNTNTRKSYSVCRVSRAARVCAYVLR